MTTTHTLTNTSHATEVCAAGDRCTRTFPFIPPGERYVLTWVGKGNRVRRWHVGCVALHPPKRPWWKRWLGRR